MSLTLHGNYLYHIKIWKVINCYFVIETDGLTLIDTGIQGNDRIILEAAQKINLPIRRITVTHAHADHAGSLDMLSKALPETEVILNQRTERFLSGDVYLMPEEPQSPIKGNFVRRNTKADRYINPGENIGSLEVISAPGHSPDQIAFFDRRDKTLIAGDAFQTQGGFAITGTIRWAFPFPALATWDKPTALETAKRLLSLSPEQLAVGHGPILDKPIEQMKKAIKKLDHR